MGIILVATIILILLFVLISSYKKVGPNEVLIITGGFLHGPFVMSNEKTHTRVKVIKGGGAFVWPIIQQAEVQSLDTFNIPVTVEDIMTKDMVPVDVKATALLRVGSDPELIAIASEKTLGLDETERNAQLTEIVKGGVREVLSGLTPLEANQRAAFQDAVIKAITSTFANLGLEITKLTITSISDKNGYFQSLYARDVANKQADAATAEAEAQKRSSLAQTKNRQEAREAELAADREIAAHEKDTNVAKAQYNAEVQKQQAIADRAHDIADAEQQAIIEAKNVEVNRQKYQATTIAKAHADAEQLEIQANASSKKMEIDANAQAKRLEITANAQAKQTGIDASAQSNKEKTLADAQAYATQKNGQAEADKINKIGKANADAQAAMQKALNSEQGQAALQMAIIKQLPELAKAYAGALANVDKLTVFDGAKGLGNQANASFAQTMQFIKDSTDIDLSQVVNNRSEGKTTINGELPVRDVK